MSDTRMKGAVSYVSAGWADLQHNFAAALLTALEYAVVAMAAKWIFSKVPWGLGGIPDFIVSSMLAAGGLLTFAAVRDGEEFDYASLFRADAPVVTSMVIQNLIAFGFALVLFLPSIVAGVIFGLSLFSGSKVSLAGLLVMVAIAVPSVIAAWYLALRVCLASFYIVFKRSGPWIAIMESWNATRGQVFELFVFSLLAVALIIVGILALGIGVLVAAPVVVYAALRLFEDLSGIQAKP